MLTPLSILSRTQGAFGNARPPGSGDCTDDHLLEAARRRARAKGGIRAAMSRVVLPFPFKSILLRRQPGRVVDAAEHEP